MQTIILKARSDEDGILRLEIPTHIAHQEIEVVLVMQAIQDEAVDEMGYPIGYFDETYGSMAHDPLERDQPLYPDIREEIE